MKVESIHIKNFRCLKDVLCKCDNLAVLVGRNGTGKSCLLRSLYFFYHTDIDVAEEDYYDQDTSKETSIAVSFSGLTELEKKLFKPYLEGDRLSIEKIITYAPSRPVQKYYGTRYQNPDFASFRKASGSALRAEYNKLIEKDEYNEFPAYQNKDLAAKTLEDWELSHEDKCDKVRDDGQFFGFQNVGKHRLEKYTKFIQIPAVQEASEEAVEERGSIFEEIMEIVVKSALASDEKLARLELETQQKYARLIDPSKNRNLQDLEKNLTGTLTRYVPDSGVKIQWIEERGIELMPPRAYVTLAEGGYHNTVDRCGHGLQRAYILALFQQLALIQSSVALESKKDEKADEGTSLPSLIIGIEEPELYQHPDRIRFFAKTLLQLSDSGIKGAFQNIQVIYSTHSPLMIDCQRFNQLRIFRKRAASEEDKPKESYVTYADLEKVSRFVEVAKEIPENSISDESLRQRLLPLMNPWMNEGFFAALVVLAEGIRDRALILGEALTRGIDLESKGICVIPCSGKDSMTEAISIFRCSEIPTYVVWDSDKGKKEGIPANQNILRCHGCQPEDYPCKITDDFCCTETNLEETFRNEIGNSKYDRGIAEYCGERDLGRPRYAMENPYIVSEIIALLRKKGNSSETLESVVNKIIEKYDSIQSS